MRYGDLAIAIRHFISRVIGPTPEIMGHSLELLKYEGLVEPVDGGGDAALLRITEDGLADAGAADRQRAAGGDRAQHPDHRVEVPLPAPARGG